MPTYTTPYDLAKPLVNNATDQDLWGGYLNDNMDVINDTMLENSQWYGAQEDIASATTCAIGGTTSANIRITGTTTITSFGTVDDGIARWVRMASALILTHNATSLILPSGANITTAANDCFRARSLGAGNWIVTDYQKADGTALVAPTVPTLASGTYTPTVSATTNIAATTPQPFQYMRVGSTVNVSGAISITASAAASTSTSFSLSLPVASPALTSEQVGGTGADAFGGQFACVLADGTNHIAFIRFLSTTTSARTWFFNFTYKISP